MSKESVLVAIKGVKDGKVIVEFNQTINSIEMDPANAIDISEALAAAAFECGTGLKPAGPALKASLVEKHRMDLTARLALMLNSMRGNKALSNGKLAQEMVEACLKAIF